MPTPTKKHFLLITIPAFGHLIPLVELAKKISDHHFVTIVFSKVKMGEIKKRDILSADDEKKINIFELDDKMTAISTDGTPGVARLLKMLLEMKLPLLNLLENLPTLTMTAGESTGNSTTFNLPVDVVIVERFLTSIVTPACHDCGVPCYVFNSSSGSSIIKGLQGRGNAPVSGSDSERPDGARFAALCTDTLNISSGIIINTFRELEPDMISEISEHPRLSCGISVWCIGPLLYPEVNKDSKLTQQVTNWMDKHKEKSIVYLSFGSVAALSLAQIPEVLKALQSIGKPFIWSLREKDQIALPESVREAILEQFSAERSQFLILSWAPQKAILAHPATKVFVTHCGWNSMLESITFGVSMVGWPMFADQHQNGSWMESKGLAVVIPDTRIEGSRIVPALEIQAAIKKVGGWTDADEGVGFFEKIQRLSKMAGEAWNNGGSSTRDFQDMINQ